MGYVPTEDQEAISPKQHYLRTLPSEEKGSQSSAWKRKVAMYRGTAPSLVLCLLLLYYTLRSTAVLTTTDQARYNYDLQAKHAYLQHMKELLDSVTVHYNTSIDSNTFVRRLTVMGVAAELLSGKGSPVRMLMPYMRGNQILEENADGSFKVVVTVDPPFKGEQCFLVQGYINYADLSGSVTKIQPVSCKERPKVWSNLRLFEWTEADVKLDQYSNGSKGKFNPLRRCGLPARTMLLLRARLCLFTVCGHLSQCVVKTHPNKDDPDPRFVQLHAAM